jgi:hypothetical protein
MLTEDNTSPPVQENEEEDNGNRDVEDDGDSVISCSGALPILSAPVQYQIGS